MPDLPQPRKRPPLPEELRAGRSAKFAPNFGAVKKDLCQTCHTSSMARQDCLTCHEVSCERCNHADHEHETPHSLGAGPPQQGTVCPHVGYGSAADFADRAPAHVCFRPTADFRSRFGGSSNQCRWQVDPSFPPRALPWAVEAREARRTRRRLLAHQRTFSAPMAIGGFAQKLDVERGGSASARHLRADA